MLRSIYFASVFSATLATSAAAQNRPTREVQLIHLGAAQPSASESGAPVAGDVPEAAQPAVTDALLTAFRVHDLSRRYVEFQMVQGFSGLSSPPLELPETGFHRVAPVSSISVPAWMRASAAFPSISYTPGCAPVPYAPSGLLGSAAEVRRATYYGMMSAIACEHGIPVGLFDAVIMQESRYNPLAVSTANAYGLAQLMPGTAASLGVNRYDVVQNLRGGARYLRQQLDRYGQVHLALAAYNAGPGRVRTKVPRITETENYVRSIIDNWSALFGTAPPPRVRPAYVRPSRREAGVQSF
ncbi:lytic transglycosylase domain-containing protein [Sphingomonas sp. R1]|uniref:lytic transglycosylase domain-containing protein n=1 Tax=Sphingomonas sp. R1 TaxID=399176 RepID=UPI0029CABDB1|nr:lytic transglycosylase domain-containing protein [Sphingomonas sp. R1]